MANSPWKHHVGKLSEQQETFAAELKALQKELEARDDLKENEELKEQLQTMTKELRETTKKYEQLQEEHRKTKVALQEQLVDEKLQILRLSKRKVDSYFARDGKVNRLAAFEQETKRKLEELQRLANEELGGFASDFRAKITNFSLELKDRIAAHREEMRLQEEALRQETDSGYQELEAEGVDDATIQHRVKENQLELKIGLNWINKIGILLIILGVAAAARYSYVSWFSPTVRGISFFILGAAMLAAGEWFYRKKREVFAYGLVGGGIGVLYGATFFSYFLLDILSLTVALVLSIFITAGAIYLSLRYNSKTIGSLGLIGGYIPLYSYLGFFGLEGNSVYIAMAYLLLLNGTVMAISFQRRWSVIYYVSFLFHIPSMLVLINISENAWIDVLYSIATFALYLVVTLAYAFRYRQKVYWVDLLLLGANTFVNSTLVYTLIAEVGLLDFRGIVALGFAALYFALGWYTKQRLTEDKSAIVLFQSVSVTFFALFVPFQFNQDWLAIGWTIQAVALIVYSLREKVRLLERAGWIIYALSLVVFGIKVMISPLLVESGISTLDYFVPTASLLFIVYWYLMEMEKTPQTEWIFARLDVFIRGLKYVALVNVWFFVVYEANRYFIEWVPTTLTQYEFFRVMLLIFLTLAVSYVVPKLPKLYDRNVHYISLGLFVLATIGSLATTLGMPTLESTWGENNLANYLAIILLLGLNAITFMLGKDLLRAKMVRINGYGEWYVLILAAYMLVVVGAIVTQQFQLGDVSFVLSSVYLVLAIGYLLYGFRKGHVYLRRVGLAVTLLSTGKLILVDLTFLSELSKIFAYFIYGIALIGISYLYQRMSNRE